MEFASFLIDVCQNHFYWREKVKRTLISGNELPKKKKAGAVAGSRFQNTNEPFPYAFVCFSVSTLPSSLKLSNFPSTVITEDAGHFIAGTSLSLMRSRWQHVRRLWWKCSHQGCNSNSFETTWISDKSFWTDLWANVTSSFIPPTTKLCADLQACGDLCLCFWL